MSYKILRHIIKSTVLFFVLSISVTALYAQIDPDGNPSDWPAVLNNGIAAVKAFRHDATNTNDDQFTQGSQDDNVMPAKWRWNFGSTNDKGDIQNTGAALIGNVLYFFGDRTAINGTAQIGFWFFLNDVFPKADGTFNSDHRAGDLLILSNFTNGGGTVGIKVYRFVRYQGTKAVFELLTTGIVAGARVNDVERNVPTNVTGWTYQSKGGAAGKYVVGSFFEGFVDLGQLTGANICFQQFLMETRNSAELTASQQDMAANDFDVLPNVNLSVTLKTGLTKSNTVTAACPELYIIDALQTTTADVTATGATSFTYTFTYSNGNAVPATEATFTPTNGTGTFEIKSADAFGKTYRIIATGSNAPGCVDKDTVCINVTGSAAPCTVTGPSPVCPGSTNTYLYNPDGTGGADALPTGFTAKWTLVNNTNGAEISGADNGNSVTVVAKAECEKAYTVKLELTSTSGFGNTSCSKTVSVDVNSDLTITCPANKQQSCGSSIDPDDTGKPTVPDNGCGIKVYYKDVITRTWTAVDACGNKVTCTQTITNTDSCVTTNTIPNGSGARVITNTGTAPTQVVSPVTSLKSPVTTIKNAPVLSPKTTSLNTGSKDLQVQAFPNPFSNTINFRFVSPVSGRAILEVFNTQGQRVGIVFDGKIDAGSAKSVQFTTRLTNQALIYKLKVGDKTVRGTVLELKR